MPPAAGRRSTAARAYGAVPAIRARDDVAPGADGRPRLLGPGWGHFMPSLDDELDDPMQARSGPIGGDAAAEDGEPDGELGDREAGELASEEEAEEAEAPEQEPVAEAEEREAEEREGEGDAEERDAEDKDAADGAEAEAPQAAVDAAVSETGDQPAGGRDLAPARDEDGEQDDDRDDGAEAGPGLAQEREDDADERSDDIANAAPVQLRASGGRRTLAAVDAGRPLARAAGARTATAARLGPIDPPIPKPRRRGKPSFDRLLRGKGWKKIGMEGVRMKRSGSTVILAIDRANRRVKLDTTSATRRFDMSRQAQKQGAAIAINGDLFGFATGKPSGLHRRNGRNLNGSKRQPGSAMFAFERAHGGRVGILSGNNRLPRWANNVVSGRPIIVNNGRVVQRYAPADQARLNSRTGRSAVGLSRDGRIMFLATASSSTTKEMANLLKRNGVDDALALDGSGSAQMWLRGKGKNRGLVRRGDRRPIANAILVKTRG